MGSSSRSTSFAAVDSHIATTNRCQVLVIGATEAVERWMVGFMPFLDRPICCWSPEAVLPSPEDVPTLVIRDVERLTAERQRELLAWLDGAAAARTRVVSTTAVPLFERVAAGLFLDTLYYRLNTVMLYGDASVPET